MDKNEIYNTEIYIIKDLFKDINDLYLLIDKNIRDKFSKLYNYTDSSTVSYIYYKNEPSIIQIVSNDKNNPLISVYIKDDKLELKINNIIYDIYTDDIGIYAYIHNKILIVVKYQMIFMRNIYSNIVNENCKKNIYYLEKDNRNYKIDFISEEIYFYITTIIGFIDNKNIDVFTMNLNYNLYLNKDEEKSNIININGNIIESINYNDDEYNLKFIFNDGNKLELFIKDYKFKDSLRKVIESSDEEYILYLYKKIEDISSAIYKNSTTNNISDGFHTFGELYDHRAGLFSVICNIYKDKAWKSKLHYDGTMYDGGYFIVGITTPEGDYSYHYKLDKWDLFDVKELDKAPEYDAHKPSDFTRLYSLIK